MFKNTVFFNSLQCCGLWDPACCSRGGILAEILPASKQYTTVYIKYLIQILPASKNFPQFINIHMQYTNIKYLDW